mgnify:FL=1
MLGELGFWAYSIPLTAARYRKRRREAPPSVLPDISPTRREIFKRGRLAPSFNVSSKAETATGLISPLVGEMPAGRGGCLALASQ